MKLLNVFGCIVLLVLFGCGGSGGEGSKLGSVFPEIDPASTPAVSGLPGRSKITGRVTDSVSGVPMSGVNVNLYSDADALLTSQSTDANGNYTFTGFASGSYKVSFSTAGYADVWYSGAADLTTTTPVTVTAPDITSGIDGVMGVGGRITGNIIDSASGTSMSGVSVNIYSGADLLTSQTTDSNGNYTLAGFVSGTYKVSFSKAGYAEVWHGGATSMAAATTVTVVSPNTNSGINGVMGIGGKITGRVTDALGASMSGVSVDLYSNTDSLLTSQSTDSNGDYTLTGFTSDTYKVSFSKAGYADVWYGGIAPLNVTVTSPNTTPGINGIMGVGGKITGRIVDYASGVPMSGVSVKLYSGADLLTSQSTDSNGDYTLAGFTSGTYKVSFTKTGYAEVWYGGIAPLDVTVISPNTTPGINGIMGTGGKITGRVVDYASGNPTSGVSVSLYSGADLLTSQTTDSNGNYTFTGFASGTYKVRFSKSGYADVWYNSAGDKSTATTVTVTSPGTTGGINGVM